MGEADEATFDKRDISQDPALQHLVVKKNEAIMWEQWGGCHSVWPSSYFGPTEVDPKAYGQKGTRARCYP